MKRREFLKKTVAGGVAATIPTISAKSEPLSNNTSKNSVDLVAVMGGEPEIMFDKGISALGGMKSFVKKGQTVVVKPNIGWDAKPERAANTNPKLVQRIVEHCYKAGAKKVYLFDNTCNKWENCYKNSGIKAAAESAGGVMKQGNIESDYVLQKSDKAIKLKETAIHKLILESDVFINVPVLKHHGGADLSISIKNLMGIVWNRRWWHSNDLHQCIADSLFYRKPDLNIVDAYRVMKRNGPRGVSVDDVITQKAQIISTDIVAADAAATKMFGENPKELRYLRLADEMNHGTMDLSKLKIERIKV
jgi:uncharacterized protein (DUF362 family)